MIRTPIELVAYVEYLGNGTVEAHDLPEELKQQFEEFKASYEKCFSTPKISKEDVRSGNFDIDILADY